MDMFQSQSETGRGAHKDMQGHAAAHRSHTFILDRICAAMLQNLDLMCDKQERRMVVRKKEMIHPKIMMLITANNKIN